MDSGVSDSGSGRDNPLNPTFGNWRGMVVGGGGLHGVGVSGVYMVTVSWHHGMTVWWCHGVSVSGYGLTRGCKDAVNPRPVVQRYLTPPAHHVSLYLS
jgi:hypothetical protein